MIPTIIHEPSGEVIAVFTTAAYSRPLCINLNDIRKVFPDSLSCQDKYDGMPSMVIEVGNTAHSVQENIFDLYALLVKHNCNKASYGPNESEDWPDWITKSNSAQLTDQDLTNWYYEKWYGLN